MMITPSTIDSLNKHVFSLDKSFTETDATQDSRVIISIFSKYEMFVPFENYKIILARERMTKKEENQIENWYKKYLNVIPI